MEGGRVAWGLDGVVVARTAISDVKGTEGKLYVRGYPAVDLSRRISYEDMVHLLLWGELPTPAQSREMIASLRDLRPWPEESADVLVRLPRTMTAIERVRTLLSLLGTGWERYPPTREDLLPFVARLPGGLARSWRARRGLPLPEPDPQANHVAHYLQQLSGSEPDPRKVRALESYFVLLAEHGLNASTFTARVVMSSWSDPASALTAAVGTLKGPLHGGAPSRVLDMFDAIGSPEKAEAWIRDALDRHERLMGFGHRVYRTEDPRVARLREIARSVADPARLALAEAVEEAGLRLLREKRPDSPLYLNVEFYASVVLEACGIPRELFTPTFALARLAGYSAHILEQVRENRLVRPEAEYVGPAPRPVPSP
jgi:citrate synthase